MFIFMCIHDSHISVGYVPKSGIMKFKILVDID